MLGPDFDSPTQRPRPSDLRREKRKPTSALAGDPVAVAAQAVGVAGHVYWTLRRGPANGARDGVAIAAADATATTAVAS